jgi:hypothetical protein
MPDPQTDAQLAELIARLEAVSEGDFALDSDIWDSLGTGILGLQGKPRSIKRYTTSLDAAVTLVPEGWFWRVGRTSIFAGWAFVHNTHHDHGEPDRNEFGWRKVAGTTPTLALCIAALKARRAT